MSRKYDYPRIFEPNVSLDHATHDLSLNAFLNRVFVMRYIRGVSRFPIFCLVCFCAVCFGGYDPVAFCCEAGGCTRPNRTLSLNETAPKCIAVQKVLNERLIRC